MKNIYNNLDKLYSATEINNRVKELGSEISRKFEKKDPIFIGVLNGSFIFMADLLRSLSIECEMDFIKVRSYSRKRSTGTIQLLKDISADVKDRNIILVEDIVDTGLTIKFLRERLFGSSPKSISIVTLLYKPSVAKFDFDIDYIGFEIPQEYVVGYGLDYEQKMRHLDSIYKIKNDLID